VKGTPWSKFPGGHRSRVTPVPIPNTEVKPTTADGTARAGGWESRSLPGLFFRARVSKEARAFSLYVCFPVVRRSQRGTEVTGRDGGCREGRRSLADSGDRAYARRSRTRRRTRCCRARPTRAHRARRQRLRIVTSGLRMRDRHCAIIDSDCAVSSNRNEHCSDQTSDEKVRVRR